MTVDHLFGGFTVRAPAALTGLRPSGPGAAGQPVINVAIEEGPTPVATRPVFAWPGRYGLRLGTLRDAWLMQPSFAGGFLIDRDGTTIRMVADQLPPPPALVDVLVRRVLPRVAILRGGVALHAAGLADGAAGLIALGRSGAGKSTLTAAWALAGHRVLADDIVVLDGDRPAMRPGATGISIWPATAIGLALDQTRCASMPLYDGKLRFDPATADPDPSPTPLITPHAVIVLDAPTTDPPRLDRLTKAEAMAALLPHLLRFNPAAPFAAERATHIVAANKALDALPAWRLRYPRDFAQVGAVVTLLRSAPDDQAFRMHVGT